MTPSQVKGCLAAWPHNIGFENTRSDCHQRTDPCFVQHSNRVLLVAGVTLHQREAACGITRN